MLVLDLCLFVEERIVFFFCIFLFVGGGEFGVVQGGVGSGGFIIWFFYFFLIEISIGFLFAVSFVFQIGLYIFQVIWLYVGRYKVICQGFILFDELGKVIFFLIVKLKLCCEVECKIYVIFLKGEKMKFQINFMFIRGCFGFQFFFWFFRSLFVSLERFCGKDCSVICGFDACSFF